MSTTHSHVCAHSRSHAIYFVRSVYWTNTFQRDLRSKLIKLFDQFATTYLFPDFAKNIVIYFFFAVRCPLHNTFCLLLFLLLLFFRRRRFLSV